MVSFAVRCQICKNTKQTRSKSFRCCGIEQPVDRRTLVGLSSSRRIKPERHVGLAETGESGLS